MGGSSKRVTVGYKYYVGMHMVFCHGPIDRFLKFSVDDRKVWEGSAKGGTRINIYASEIFGGESREGGISGSVDILDGSANQGQNDYLVSKLGAYVPNFRGVASVVLRRVYMGLNPYLKKWKARIQRVYVRQNGLLQWNPSRAGIGNAGNAGGLEAEYFENGLSGYVVELGNFGNYSIVNDSGFNAIQLDNTFAPYCRISRVFEVPFIPQTITFSGKFIKDGTDDGGLIIFGTETSNAIICHFPRESSIDAQERIYVNGVPVSNSKPNIGEWYTVEILLDAVNNKLAVKINNGAFGSVSGIAWDGMPISRLKFQIEYDTGARSSCRFANIEVWAEQTGHIDMNPAHIIRECLTDPDWGMGYQDSDIDDSSFIYAARKLHDERMGMSIIWDTQTTIEEFINIVVRHIDAALFVDRKTGKFVLKLIRNDFDKNSLLILNEGNVEKLSDFSRAAFGELTNSVTVSYWDAVLEETSTITVQDIALAQEQGATINTSLTYEGFTSASIAARVAQRDLKSLSTPLAKCVIYANADASNLNIGDVFKLSWNDFEISEMVMRVVGIAYGDGKSNKVRIQCSQDVFALPEISFITPPGSSWEDENAPPNPIVDQICYELPYMEMVQRNGQTEVDSLLFASPEVSYVGAACLRPEGSALNSRFNVDSGAGYEDFGMIDFAPGATLAESISEVQTIFAISNAKEVDNVSLGTWGQIGTELVKIEAISATSVTVGRGLLDTVPKKHNEGDKLFIWDVYSEACPTEFVSSDVVNIKLLTVSGSGQIGLDAAAEMTVNCVGRAARPYPPGNLKLSGLYFPPSILAPSAIVLSWTHRDRIQQTGGSYVVFTDGDIGPEPGTTYTAQLWNDSTNVLIEEFTGITGKEQTFSAPPFGANILRFEIWSVRSGIASYQKHVHVFEYVKIYNLITENSNIIIAENGDAITTE